MADGKKERVGIVGAGRMGLSMLKHLVKNGYAVTVCDISEKQREAARAAGASIAATPADVGKASDIVILGVGYDDEVNDVVFGKNGLLETMAPGSIIAVSSTAKPDTVKAVAARVAEKGIDVLDAPICRGRFAADEGTLLALVGGKAEVVARAPAGLRHLCLRHRPSRRRRPRPGRQDHEQSAAVGERSRSYGGRQARRNHRHRSRQIARGADDELRRVGRAQGMGHDLVHLGAQGHADRRRHDRQSRPVAADHRRDQGTGQGRPPHQGEQSAELDRQRAGQIRSRHLFVL